MALSKKQIFVSHTSKDKNLVDKLVDLLTVGCSVNPNVILCTSLEGKGIPAGTPSFIDYLKNEIQDPKLVILVLSENFFESHFCLCELGAVWAMGLPNFPLVVPPTKKSELKATLAVTQAGNITDESYLDDLRDRVRDAIGCEVPTSTWNVKRDSFLEGLPELLAKLPKPSKVSAKQLEAAKSQYQVALDEIKHRDTEIQSLKAHVADLEKCKNKEQVRAISNKYTKADELFSHLCETAKKKLGKLESATCSAIYWARKGNPYRPSCESDWDDAKEAEAVEEVRYDEDTGTIRVEYDHPRVADAEAAIAEVSDFLENPKNEKYLDQFAEDHKFPASITNKDFWSTYLVSV